MKLFCQGYHSRSFHGLLLSIINQVLQSFLPSLVIRVCLSGLTHSLRAEVSLCPFNFLQNEEYTLHFSYQLCHFISPASYILEAISPVLLPGSRWDKQISPVSIPLEFLLEK